MQWLNYHHLMYFWVVAREGTIARACEQLKVSQPAISGQIRMLEKELGEKLFARVGRNLELTDTGELVYQYAEEIFSSGRELLSTLANRSRLRLPRVLIGISDSLPNLLVYRLLKPALELSEPVQVVCRTGPTDELLAELSVQGVDLVLSDSPASPTVKVKTFKHPLGESTISIFGTSELVAQHGKEFPKGLSAAPFLMPADNSPLRRALELWFESEKVFPVIKGEFEDTGIMKAVGAQGHGLFPMPTVLESQIKKQYNVQSVGQVDSLKLPCYLLSLERKLKNPAVQAIADGAKGIFDH